MYLSPRQTQPEEYVARVLMMVCSISAAEASSLARQAGEVHVGTWERSIAEHAYAGMAAKGVLADLIPAHTHRADALVAVKADGMALMALKHASPELQADREVVLAAVQQNGEAFHYAAEELQADREVVLAAVQQYGYYSSPYWVLKYASPELRADRKVVLAAVQQDGRALAHASPELRADRDVVLAAVQQDGRALYSAPPELQADREVVLAAVQQNAVALRYASAQLQRDGAVLKASKHIFADLDRLADHGQLKVLRTLASVQECGRQMNNCLQAYDLAQCSRHILVKLDGDDGLPLAVGSFANGEWPEIRYANNEDARRGGNRACGRGGAAALPPANSEEILGQFDAFLPALQAFCDSRPSA